MGILCKYLIYKIMGGAGGGGEIMINRISTFYGKTISKFYYTAD